MAAIFVLPGHAEPPLRRPRRENSGAFVSPSRSACSDRSGRPRSPREECSNFLAAAFRSPAAGGSDRTKRRHVSSILSCSKISSFVRSKATSGHNSSSGAPGDHLPTSTASTFLPKSPATPRGNVWRCENVSIESRSRLPLMGRKDRRTLFGGFRTIDFAARLLEKHRVHRTMLLVAMASAPRSAAASASLRLAGELVPSCAGSRLEFRIFFDATAHWRNPTDVGIVFNAACDFCFVSPRPQHHRVCRALRA